MLLYTPGARDLLGVDDSQMVSDLAQVLDSTNSAMANSVIDLEFVLVRVEPVRLHDVHYYYYKGFRTL